MIRSTFGTIGLCAIWTLELINYLVHVSLRPRPWNAVSTACGYALWGLQLASFAQCQATDPGYAPQNWRETHDGAGAYVCKRTGEVLPPRAMYVRRAGGVVLGLDHYCYWLGTPVGWGNRKFFVLFVCYSALFCAMGSVHSAYDLLCSLPDAMAPPALP